MVVKLETIADRMPELGAILEEFKQSDVLVGIPERRGSREGEALTNAELLFIHTHGVRKKAMREEMQEAMDTGSPYSEAYQLYIQEYGSPLWHSPPRPVLEPAITDQKEEIARELSKAVAALLEQNPIGFQVGLHRAGQIAENAARDWFTNPKNGWAPNSVLTVAEKGSSNPLIDTGQMRKAITHVVRRKEAEENA